MSIFVNEKTGTFHLRNDAVSYIMTVLPNGHMGQLYFGARIHHREDFSYLLEGCHRSHAAYPYEDGKGISLEVVKQEYPVYGSGDYRQCALEVEQENGSRLTDFVFRSCEIQGGKPAIPGLPATYTEDPSEAETLILTLEDSVAQLTLKLYYTIFKEGGILARSVRIFNHGKSPVYLDRVMSLCLDLPDGDYHLMTLNGAWARERTPEVCPLRQGIQGVESLRGHSSHQYNPFMMLLRPGTDEASGEAMGFSLVYSGNFLARVQLDPHHVTRVLMGIHPDWFRWKLEPGDSFASPEAVMVYSREGIGGVSRTFHRLYQKRLCRGVWRDQPRPILLNNWEATYFDFNEEKLLSIAAKAKECGVELFVLDDGWFGGRRNDFAGLGDWYPAKELLPEGIAGLSRKVEEMGLKFGLWFEPEMVNPDSDLYRAHPDWVLSIPERRRSLSRHQMVLDFSRPEVVDAIHSMIASLIRESRISYIKWDMNRSITECYSSALPPDRQGEVFHRYILGVYDLYERLIGEFPQILFESCAGGGGRFDAGMLYYAPQTWTSDDTDAVERLKIQYGTSIAYPVSSMGSHVSAVPNHQLHRITPLKTRAEVAYFGTYGYELDLNTLTEKEQEEVRACTEFMKEHRSLLQFGSFYRLLSPFEGNETAWMVVSEDRKEAILAHYRVLNVVNAGFTRIRLQGLDPDLLYHVSGGEDHYGDELMNLGLITSDDTTGKAGKSFPAPGDFLSSVYLIRAASESGS